MEIKPLSLPYYITSTTNTTRASNTSDSLTILEKLFVGPDTLFQYDKNYNGKNGKLKTGDRSFNIILNPDIYDDFINEDVITQSIYDYVTKQTVDFGKKYNFIKDSDKVEWTTKSNRGLLNKPINSVTNSGATLTFRLVINGNAFTMFIGNSSNAFDISRSDTDVWPN